MTTQLSDTQSSAPRSLLGTDATIGNYSAALVRGVREYLGLVLVLVGMLIFFSFASKYFFSLKTFSTIANEIPALTVMAVGMTFVMIIGGIDLSVGSVLALCGGVLSLAMVTWQWGFIPAAALALSIGFLCGMVNGLISVIWSVPSFIVTLGMLEIARGSAYLATSSRTEYIGNAVAFISDPVIAGISPAFLIAILIVVAGQVILSYTVFGRHMIGIGTNEEAMRLAGIRIRPTKTAVFALLGLLSAVAASFQVSRLEAADPNAAAGMELQVIAAVVIGGTSLLGGRGSVINTFIGVLIISILEAGLAQIGASDPAKRIITGLVIVIAVIVDMYRNRTSAGKH
ncbi:ribose transport system permease protein [Collimonas sp. OK307]|uniref:ABC transporter permease n=1 Tax=Collimonas sp. OK307 TaxID=1801620 RepID=UPI0008E15212|nr:ABC transporter permease [Collimonas sp. OK307]SFI37923.1 ribose transport system permease protein [Collimonas sp. OK307]